MRPREIRLAIADHLEAFVAEIFPDAERIGDDWHADFEGTPIVIHGGVNSGQWTFQGETRDDLVGLMALRHGTLYKDAHAACLMFLAEQGAEFPEEAQPAPEREEKEPAPASNSIEHSPGDDDLERELTLDGPDNQGPTPPRPPQNGSHPQGIHRMLPADPDAEKALIGSFFLDPDFTGTLCRARGVTPAYFHIPAHATLFDEINFLWNERMPVDLITFTAHLRDAGKLDQVGGPAFVTDLFLHMPTAANAGAYLEILAEKRTLRQVIRVATEMLARAYESRVRAPHLLADLEQGAKIIAATLSFSQEAERPLVPLMDISTGESAPRKTVLGDRFLCIGGTMLFVGPSGIGKSSASVQQDILWGLGREAFGIRPSRPLRILTIQAENDGEDLAEMREGVCRGLGISDSDRQAVRERVFYETECGRTSTSFLAYVENRLKLGRFDALRIDPLMAYLGGDPSNPEVTAAFLRNGLNPLLAKYEVAGIINHHTPKVTNRDTSHWRGSDWMYAGAGSADITNWARAILVIDPTHAPGVFKFIAAKRGSRIGWINDQEERETCRHFCHATDGIYWRAADDADIEAAQQAAAAKKSGREPKSPADLKALVPAVGAIVKAELLEAAKRRGFTKRMADETLKDLLENEVLYVWAIPRRGTRDQVQISRKQQELADVNR